MLEESSTMLAVLKDCFYKVGQFQLCKDSLALLTQGAVTLDFEHRFTCCNGRDMTSRNAASFQKLKFNTKHAI